MLGNWSEAGEIRENQCVVVECCKLEGAVKLSCQQFFWLQTVQNQLEYRSLLKFVLRELHNKLPVFMFKNWLENCSVVRTLPQTRDTFYLYFSIHWQKKQRFLVFV
eukprot:TRINITY_DN6878_c0_g1_i1.p8 TRINITY_DN6878_c0_g1~~TRINITY_DN6878_c0_g1_i1.p8  ORF type:complete len:106 (+),score=3.34 TRINITY_DN6878_c0_g1_i1:1696-2013(+)